MGVAYVGTFQNRGINMALLSHIQKHPDLPSRRKDDFNPCRKTISIMQFFRNIFSKNTYLFLNLSKEVILALIITIFPIFYPTTVNAGIFSSVSNISGRSAFVKGLDVEDAPNSQNMPVLKAVANVNPVLALSDDNVPISQNSLLAEIGPSGTISEIVEPINTQISIYVVRKGDTLSQIADMFDVSTNTIVWANDLGKNRTIVEGQNLVILPITGIRHTVKKGETIRGIVEKYKANLNEVLLDNDLSINSTLAVGHMIIIPDVEPSIGTAIITVGVKNPVGTNAGYYRRPIDGGRKSQGLHGNNGVDLAASFGTPIYAAANGTVMASMKNGGWNGGYGNYVIISHANGTQTLYSHNSVNLVFAGQTVKKGEIIARIGMTGKTTGPHVHFEIRGAKNPF